MRELETLLTNTLGGFNKKVTPVNGKYSYITSYSLPLKLFPTIDLVVVSPYVYEVFINNYVINDDNCFYYFLYDNETDIIIGDIVSIDFDWEWKEELLFYIYTSEERLSKCECPVCSFWLVQRMNIYQHKFLGCSGFPECTFSGEVEIILNLYQ